MSDSRQRDAPVVDELITVALKDLLERGATRAFVPAFAGHRPDVDNGLFDLRVAGGDGVPQEIDVGCDAHLQQEHEQLAEAREARALRALESPADLGGGMR